MTEKRDIQNYTKQLETSREYNGAGQKLIKPNHDNQAAETAPMSDGVMVFRVPKKENQDIQKVEDSKPVENKQ